jgi:transposase
MPKRIKLREMTGDERCAVVRLARAHTAPAQLVKRAQLLRAMLEDPTLSPSEASRIVGYSNAATGINWVKRFNAEGLDGLKDRPRPGAPPTHTQEVRSQLVGLALQKPATLGYPFALWTLERLQRAFEERYGVHLSDSTIWTWMDEEGFEWKRQASWFHDVEKHDPAFVEKRGPSSSAT